MSRKQQRLAIWMNGIKVGYWEKSKGVDSLQYLPDWSADEQGRPLSLSLPFTPGNQVWRGNVVRDYFDNLLPDSEGIRRRLAMRYKADSLEPFDLLTELGKDCVGAIQLLHDGDEPTDLYSVKYHPLTESEIAATLRNTTETLLPGRPEDNDDLRLSIAGAQEKTALLWHEDRWCMPEGNTPTTHIFKLPLGLVGNMKADMSSSVENEWLCSVLLEQYGLPVARTQIAHFEDQKALVVERFDRKWSGDGQWIIRLPQEDMCQAFGLPSSVKYESDGGPGILPLMSFLLGSSEALQDRYHFMQFQLFQWLLAATDGHAKNFSVFIQPGGSYRLTPFYDILSAYPLTAAFPDTKSPPARSRRLPAISAFRGSWSSAGCDKSRHHVP